MAKFEIVSKYADCGLSLPVRGTAGAAGYDFCVAEDITIPSIYDIPEPVTARDQYIKTFYTLDEVSKIYKEGKYKPVLVPTGIKCQLDPGYYLELSIRSSSPLKYWLILANGVGIIDTDYYNNPDNEGHIFFQIINLGPCAIKLQKGDRIGQGIIKRYYLADGDSLSIGASRKGGFGSTGTDTHEKYWNSITGIDAPQYRASIFCETKSEGEAIIEGWGNPIEDCSKL